MLSWTAAGPMAVEGCPAAVALVTVFDVFDVDGAAFCSGGRRDAGDDERRTAPARRCSLLWSAMLML
eukprot:COSAG02_NODE_2142_length_9685_cov_83.241707_11_plen_66_part_01